MIVSSLEYAKYAVLRASFTDPVAHGMTLGATKAFYSIAFGLGPYFHEVIVNDTRNSWYTLLVDETTTDQNVKQFDIMLDAGARLRIGWFASMLPLHS